MECFGYDYTTTSADECVIYASRTRYITALSIARAAARSVAKKTKNCKILSVCEYNNI